MKFMLLVKSDATTEAGVLPDEKLLTEMGRFNEELIRSGAMLAGEGLHPTSKGARVRFSGTRRTVLRGPFSGANDLIAGFWLINAPSMDDAIELVKRVPNPTGPEGEIEIRQVFEEEDFGDLVDKVPEVFAAERKFRADVAAKRSEMEQRPGI